MGGRRWRPRCAGSVLIVLRRSIGLLPGMGRGFMRVLGVPIVRCGRRWHELRLAFCGEGGFSWTGFWLRGGLRWGFGTRGLIDMRMLIVCPTLRAPEVNVVT